MIFKKKGTAFGFSFLVAGSPAFHFENADKLLPFAEGYSTAAPGVAVHFVKNLENFRWNHQLQAKLARVGFEYQVSEEIGTDRLSPVELGILRYQTSLSYQIPLSENFSVSPKLGLGVGFPLNNFWLLIGNIDETSGYGFGVEVTEDDGQSETILEGNVEIETKVHPVFFSGIIIEYDTQKRLFFQAHFDYNVSNSTWTTNGQLTYYPENIESDFSYQGSNVFSASLGVFLRGPFGIKRQQNPAYN